MKGCDMPWEENRNIRSLSPHGLKAAEGHAVRSMHDPRCVVGDPMPPGLLSPMKPLGATRSSPYMPRPSAAGEKPQR
jgi:hypothetical protein